MTEKKRPPTTRKSRRSATGRNLADALRRAVEDVDDASTDPPVEAPAPSRAPEEASYRIGEVAQLVGVDAHVLRYWESEFQLKPERSPSGQRIYRQPDLARFLRIKSLLHDEGYTIAGARRVLEGGGDSPPVVDVARIQSALDKARALRERLHELRDGIEIDMIQR